MSKTTTLYVGTENGLMSMTCFEGHWQTAPLGLFGKKVVGLAFGAFDTPDLIAAVQGYGLFRSEDDGHHWHQIHAANARCLLQDYAQPDRLWLGVEPAGVHRSLDGGQTWVDLTEAVMQVPTALDWSYPEPPFQARLGSLGQHPHQPDTVFAGIDTGGVIRSDDGGDHWINADEGLDEEVHTLAVSPQGAPRWFATTGAGVYQADNAGQRWHPISDEVSLSYADPIVALSSDLCLAGVAGTPPGTWIENAISHLIRSVDAGQSWQTVEFGQSTYISVLAGDPNQADTVYLGTASGQVYLSYDRGMQWVEIAQLAAGISLMVAT